MWGGLLVVVLATAGAAPQADAQQVAPEGSPGIDQYSPSLPSAEGERVPGVRRGPSPQPQPLPRGAAAELAATPEGAALEQLATDPALGAPARPPPTPAAEPPGRAADREHPPKTEAGAVVVADALLDTPALIVTIACAVLLFGIMRFRRRPSIP